MNLYTFALGSVALLIKLYADFYQLLDFKLTLWELRNDASLPRIKTYDFIIVGGGGAGCILASRLSEHHKVLLLEAGGNPVPATQALVHYIEVIHHPQINFIFNSVPQTHAALAYGGNTESPTGKMLGGSTSHNGLIFNRGNPKDFDRWAEITNDSSWKYDAILKYFKRSERYIGANNGDNGRSLRDHGRTGPMTIDLAITPLLRTWLDAGAELGFKTRLDPNEEQIEGFAAEAVSQKKGRRVSTYTAYIEPIEKKRKYTLRIERYSNVSEILINEKGRAYGVAYTRHGIPEIAHASKEIIISCGSIGTPLLLMKSGIGPSSVLKKAGIPVKKNLPVGIGLHEHPGISMPPFKVTNDTLPLFKDLKRDLTEDALIQFQEKGKGPIVLALEGQAFVVSRRAKRENEMDWPDLVLQLGEPLPPYPGYWLGTTLFRVKSFGSVTLNTTAYKAGIRNDEGLAVIDFNLLGDQSDVDVLLEGMKLWLKILEKTKAFQKFGFEFIDPKLPGCAGKTFRTDEYWRCYIGQLSGISFHLLGGCRMGSGENDKGSVVDSRFNVLGVPGLKIVDASIMPHGPNANPAAAVIMIAEKASQEILSAWKFQINNPLTEKIDEIVGAVNPDE